MQRPQSIDNSLEKGNAPRSISKKLIYAISVIAILPTIPVIFSGMVGFGLLMWLIGTAIGLIYFLPTFAALRLGHINTSAIVWLNVLLGWTFIGWVIAVVWAYKRPEINNITQNHTPNADHMACPFCAEPIKTAAIKCRHCGSDLTAH